MCFRLEVFYNITATCKLKTFLLVTVMLQVKKNKDWS